MHNIIVQCSIIAKTLVFHQRNKGLRNEVSVEQLAECLE
jgi:hypothetical protein